MTPVVSPRRRRVITWVAVMLAGMGVLPLAACLHDWSGLTRDSQGRILAVNNRPGVFATCTPRAGQLSCKRLTFQIPDYGHYDLEGVTWVNDHLFYAVSEKRDNQCLSGCELSQDVLPFRIDENGHVATSQCGAIRLPLMEGDNPDCAYANCGLEGVAYDPGRNVLYVGKEREQTRLFAVALDERHCPTGVYRELKLPLMPENLSDLAFSVQRDSLFILSSRSKMFYEWDLDGNVVRLKSDDLPEAKAFLDAEEGAEGIYVDDTRHELWLLTEAGAFGRFTLPPLP